MRDFKWMNACTGEVFYTLMDAIKTMFLDIIRCEKCRTVEMLHIVRL